MRPDHYRRFSGAIVSGPYAGYFGTDMAEETSVMGVHFKPGGAFPFLGLAADELADTHINLEDIWGQKADELRERVSMEQSPRRRFRLLEEVLLSRLFQPWELHPAVSLALDRLPINTARSVVRNLVRESGLSNRWFVYVFRFQVGVKPKLFARIQRFQRVLSIMHCRPTLEWGQLALEQGYFDQSYLIRDFVAFSGLRQSPASGSRRSGETALATTHNGFSPKNAAYALWGPRDQRTQLGN